MAAVKAPVYARGKRFAKRVAPKTVARLSEARGSLQQWQGFRRELDQTKRRVAVLEAEVQEARRLNRRLAEVTDVLEEVLMSAVERDDVQFRHALQKYADTM